jgi:zinc protease
MIHIESAARKAACTAALALSILWAGPGFGQKKPKDTFEFPALNAIRTPQVVQATLKNGMRLLLVEDREVPTVDLRAMIRTGAVHDPAGKTGLASITATVMRTGGSAKFPGDALDQLLETLGASVETGMGQTEGSVGVSALKADADKALEVLADVLANPAFPEDKIELAKIELKSAISRRNDEVGQITDREFNRLIYGKDSPYAAQAEYATVDAVTRDDLAAFHGKFYHPENMILAAWGDFSAKDMRKKIETAFAGWKRGGADAAGSPAVDYAYDFSVNMIEKPDVNQSNIQLGHIGTTMDNPDYPALVVMNQILSFDRMFKRIRTDEGLAYSVWGYYGADYDHPGAFSAGCQTKSESTIKAIRLMLDEVRRMQNEDVTERELNKSKDQYLNGFVFNFDSNGKIVRRQMTYAYYGYPADFSEKVKAGVEKVTAADVRRVAQKYLRPDKVRILVVGKQADFDEPLSVLGPVNVIDIAIPEPKEAVAEATPEAEAKGRAFAEAALKAMGGREALAAVKTLQGSVTASQSTPMGDLNFAGTASFAYPSSMHMKMTTPYGEIVMALTPDAAWMVVPQQGAMPMPEAQAQSMRRGLMRDPVVMAKNWDGLALQYAGQRDFNGTKVEDVIVSKDGVTFHWLLDPATGLPAGTAYTESGPQGPVENEEIWSEYQAAGSLLLPMKQVTMSGGQKASETLMTDVRVDAALDPNLFVKP